MKAVKKFKSLIDKKRPALLSATLGRDVRIVYPSERLGVDSRAEPALRKSRSTDIQDRRAVEGALASEGVHHDMDFAHSDEPGYMSSRIESGMTVIEGPAHGPQDRKPPHYKWPMLNSDDETSHGVPELDRQEILGDKGHAHDPLDEAPLFLGIGAGGQDLSNEQPQGVVAESPTAAEFSIYDTAYQNEVDRIRSTQGHQTTVYLTRRVDKKKKYKADENMIAAPKESEVAGLPHEGWKGLLDRARAKGEELQEKEKSVGTGHILSDIVVKAVENKKILLDLSRESGLKNIEERHCQDESGGHLGFAGRAMENSKHVGECATSFGKDLTHKGGVALESVMQMTTDKEGADEDVR